MDAEDATRQAAVRTLAIDAATAEVATAFDRAQVPHLLLKGPAVVHWLYAGDVTRRGYGDVDLLVPPVEYGRAAAVLEELGYACTYGRAAADDRPWLHGLAWQRPGSAEVDLHRGFHGVADWDTWWEVLAGDAETITVGGRAVRIPGRAACALVVALHALALPVTDRAARDLRTALDVLDPPTWREAARRAALCGALEHLRLSVTHADPPEPVRVAVLGDEAANRDDEIALALRARSLDAADPAVARALTVVAALGGPWSRDRLRTIRRALLPPRDFLRGSYPWVDRSPAHHGAAVLARLLRIVRTAPRVVLTLVRARHRRGPASR